MIQRLVVLFALALLLASGAEAQIRVYFSPDGGCTAAIVSALNGARRSIHVQAYSFTSAPIAKALVDAHRRKVKVQAILDDSQRGDKYSSADFLNNAGVKPGIDSRHAIAHDKVMIIDEQVVITGSFNFTTAAEERNAENLLVITDRALAAKYLANWQKHATHSEPYVRVVARSKAAPRKEKDVVDWQSVRRWFEKLTK
jgi:phosphatidylserine/phosphatidylglycerophosphate/cardiolipin synthase-like enzyme